MKTITMNAKRIATTITTMLIMSVMSNGPRESSGVSVGAIVGEGVIVELGVGVTSGEGVGVTEGDGVGVGVGVGVVGGDGMVMLLGMDGAAEFGSSKYGSKFNVPKLEAFL